jgi:hypothetical protein
MAIGYRLVAFAWVRLALFVEFAANDANSEWTPGRRPTRRVCSP